MSVKSRLHAFLQTGKTISVAQARHKFHAINIAGRVYDLREDGIPVRTTKTNTGRYVYSLRKAG